VDRNRLKRRLRELVRTELLPALRERPSIDMAIRSRPDAYRARLDALRADVLSIQSRVTGNDART
jgi:RNase P protein component